MIKTYVVEDYKNDNQVVGYTHTLGEAKELLLDYGEHGRTDFCILMMQGCVAFGEGFHKYRLYYNGQIATGVNKLKAAWKRVKV